MAASAGLGSGSSTTLERLFNGGATLGLSEAELLDRFVGGRDEAAFAALVDRHGPMVLGVCRRLLHDPHEAEDAFQAVFLVLARKAGGIGRKELVGNWLYGVSLKVATRARRLAARRPKTGDVLDYDARRPSVPGPAESVASNEAAARLHEEVARLPERYRAAVVACYFEGKSCEETAALLGCPVGTVKGRLSRARDLLRKRLERRGVTDPAALLTTALAAPDVRASVPAALAAQAVRAGLAAASSPYFVWMTASVASTSIHSLAEGVLRTMFLAKLKSLAIPTGLIAAGLLVAGAGLAASQDDPKPDAEKAPKPAAKAEAAESPDSKAAGEPQSKPAPRRSQQNADLGIGRRRSVPQRSQPIIGPGVVYMNLSNPVYIAKASAFLEAHGDTGVNQGIYDALDRKLSIRLGEDSTLGGLLKQVRAVKNTDGKPMPVFVSRAALESEGVDLSTPIELELDDVPLRPVLRLALKDLGLAFCVRDGILIISTEAGVCVELEEAQGEWLARNPEGYEIGNEGIIQPQGKPILTGEGFK